MTSNLRVALQQVLAKFKEADEERYRNMTEFRAESLKHKAAGDMYGYNFHAGMDAGANWVALWFYRVQRELEALIASAPDETAAPWVCREHLGKPHGACPDCARAARETKATPGIPEQVRAILESYFWLPTLAPNTRYARLHDDHDGKRDGWLSVTIGEDGDAWVDAQEPNLNGLRFRMPMIGGGASQYTRTALVILAEAIRLDNETAPLRGAEKTPAKRCQECGDGCPGCEYCLRGSDAQPEQVKRP